MAGRYRVVRRLGGGAMGVVWECVDEVLDRTVAVKQLLLPPGLDEAEAAEARARAMREGRIAARLQHQHAIAVYDVATDEGQPVLVMEYLASRSLATVLAEHGPLPPREVARIGAQVASALAAAHAAGVVHRDVKPGNVLLGDDGTVKITDFGISRAQDDAQVTKTGMLTGTPAFLSPDVAMGEEPTPASDVFSLGSTLYTAVEGKPPFGLNDNALAMLHVVASGRIDPPVEAGPLTRPLLLMLRTRVEDRPNMAAVKEMLADVAEGRTGSLVSIPVPVVAAGEGSVAGGVAEKRKAGRAAGEAASYVVPAKDWRPLGVTFVAQIAAAVIGVLVTAAFVGGQSLGDNRQNQNGPHPVAPPPPAQSSPGLPGPPPPPSTSDSLSSEPPPPSGPTPTTTDNPTTITVTSPAPSAGQGPSQLPGGPTLLPPPPISGPPPSSSQPSPPSSTSPPSNGQGVR